MVQTPPKKPEGSPVKGTIVLFVLVVFFLAVCYFLAMGATHLQWKFWLEDKVEAEVGRRWREELPPGTCLFFEADGTVRWVPITDLQNAARDGDAL